MISFVWSSKYPMKAGTGGSENYTVGQARELMRRGIRCRIITVGFGTDDGRDEFPDIDFLSVNSKEDLQDLDDTLIFVTYPLAVKTRHTSYAILHCPPPTRTRGDDMFDPLAHKGKRLIVPSKFAAKMWGSYYGKLPSQFKIAYPFAERHFGRIDRPDRKNDTLKILFAGRLTPDKGIYTLLASLHMYSMLQLDYELTVTEAHSHGLDGEMLLPMLKANQKVKIVPARKTSQEMAQLMAEHDILVAPSTSQFWQETFGIVSVEAQHAGCRVVASKSGGLPETDCGGLVLVKPDNPMSLANGIVKAAHLGPLTATERRRADNKYTVEQSVNALLRIIGFTEDVPARGFLHGAGAPIPLIQPQLALFGDHLKRAAFLPRNRGGNGLSH